MTPKDPTTGPSPTKPSEAAEAATAEPIVVKDRRFWQKKDAEARDSGEAAQAEPGPTAEQVVKLEGEVARLTERLGEKEARLNATMAQYKDALDEFESVKARLKRDVRKEVEAGRRTVLTDLLEVVDNLDRALTAAPEAERGHGLFQGVTMVRDQFHAKLAAQGVKKLEALGLPFDPNHFEAISTIPVAVADQHDTVMGVVRDAYLLNDETLRHGIVAVGKFTE